jgi:hypothetical protein
VAEELVEVRLVGVPLDIHRLAGEQSAEVMREFAHLVEGPTVSEAPARLIVLDRFLQEQYRRFSQSTSDEIQAAIARGASEIDVGRRWMNTALRGGTSSHCGALRRWPPTAAGSRASSPGRPPEIQRSAGGSGSSSTSHRPGVGWGPWRAPCHGQGWGWGPHPLEEPGVGAPGGPVLRRRGWDLNPRSLAGHTISNRADSAALAPLLVCRVT